MLTILSALVGFLGSVFPEFIKLFKDGSDKKHELQLLNIQMEMQKQGYMAQLEAVHIQTEATEQTALYKTYKTGIQFIDGLNGSVRPVLAYAFFLLYAGVKVAQLYLFLGTGASMAHSVMGIWTEEDQAIFAGIISFYYGSRAFSRKR